MAIAAITIVRYGAFTYLPSEEAMIKFNRLSTLTIAGILDKGISMQKEQLSGLMDGER